MPPSDLRLEPVEADLLERGDQAPGFARARLRDWHVARRAALRLVGPDLRRQERKYREVTIDGVVAVDSSLRSSLGCTASSAASYRSLHRGRSGISPASRDRSR